MPQELNFLSNFQPLSVVSLLIHLGIGAVMALVLRWHFQRFGSTLTNRNEFAQVFPLVLLTTILIISIVKSSLALSLGLVGALSIVRFRTPIKEPEELAYLFISIAIGLGLGAEQTQATVISGVVILGLMALFKYKQGETIGKNMYLSIDWNAKEGENIDRNIEHLNSVITKHVVAFDLRRFDVRDGSLESTYYLDVADIDNLSALLDELKRTFPDVGITFLDQNQLPSI